ncbi:hypothetical protein [Cumulibacter manganitolerans]|uniref:hypothetical protein n=1 Tax=Cumulibacter manganitolerans TaxID=1884992 RepID=UPI001296DE3F|nr:hypothetical protein [Cumulibacter manganitolerans]
MGQKHYRVDQILVMIAEYEDAPRGQKALTLRRLGVSRQSMGRWMFMRDAGDLASIGKRGGWRMTPRGESAELTRLRARIRELEGDLSKAEADRDLAVKGAEVLGKARELLQILADQQEQQDRSETS